jgi:hypothetical protein
VCTNEIRVRCVLRRADPRRGVRDFSGYRVVPNSLLKTYVRTLSGSAHRRTQRTPKNILNTNLVRAHDFRSRTRGVYVPCPFPSRGDSWGPLRTWSFWAHMGECARRVRPSEFFVRTSDFFVRPCFLCAHMGCHVRYGRTKKSDVRTKKSDGRTRRAPHVRPETPCAERGQGSKGFGVRAYDEVEVADPSVSVAANL